MGRKAVSVSIPDASAKGASIQLDANLVQSFSEAFLMDSYDSPLATPAFHNEMWADDCSPNPFVASAAPRGHGKTSRKQAFCLAAVLFGFRDYILHVGATEGLAAVWLKDIRMHLANNEKLIEIFQIHGLSKDSETYLECCVGDRVFAIHAKGALQRLRGLKFRSKRPNLILADDIEDDEQVASKDRREKLYDWFFKALIPAGSDNCLVRVSGTIMHEDSLLSTLIKDTNWVSKLYSAHKDYDDFSDILWPEKFPEGRLRRIRDMMSSKGQASIYSGEYLNKPIASSEQYFRKEWFLPMDTEDRKSIKRYYAGVDLAISTKTKSDRTSITVCGIDMDGIMHIMHNIAGRWDSHDIVNALFEVQQMYRPEFFLIERGHIELALGPFLNSEMVSRGKFLNIEKFVAKGDKVQRARSFQGRMRAGGVRFDVEADWYPALYHEMSVFPKGQHDDRVDSTACIGLMLEGLQPAEEGENEWEDDLAYQEFRKSLMNKGRCEVTGY